MAISSLVIFVLLNLQTVLPFLEFELCLQGEMLIYFNFLHYRQTQIYIIKPLSTFFFSCIPCSSIAIVVQQPHKQTACFKLYLSFYVLYVMFKIHRRGVCSSIFLDHYFYTKQNLILGGRGQFLDIIHCSQGMQVFRTL